MFTGGHFFLNWEKKEEDETNLSKMAVIPEDHVNILKGTDQAGKDVVDHKPDLTAHPNQHSAVVEGYRQHVLDSPDPVKIKGKKVPGSSNYSKKVIYKIPKEVLGVGGESFMVKPYHEEVGQAKMKKWTKHLHQGWSEMTSQALYHAAGIGHLHQNVHVSEHNMGPGHEAEPALVVHISPEYKPVSSVGISPLGEQLQNVRKIGLMDYLMGNLDRHSGNLLIKPVNGEPLAIDHSRSFQYINTHKSKWDSEKELSRLRDRGMEDSLEPYIEESAISLLDPLPRNASLYNPFGKRLSDKERYNRIDNHREQWQKVYDWFAQNSDKMSQVLDKRLEQIKDPVIRKHIKRNFNARKDQLDEMADFGLGNYGRDDWYKNQIPLYQPNEMTDQELRNR